MDAGAKTRVTDQLFGGVETGDIADRGKDGQHQGDAKTGDLEGEGHRIPTLGGIAKAGDLRIELGDLRFEMVKGFEGMAEKDFLGRGEGKGIPPTQVLVGERTAWRKLEHVAVKEAVKAVTGHGLDPNQAATMSEEAAGFTDVEGGTHTWGMRPAAHSWASLMESCLSVLTRVLLIREELAGVGNFYSGD
jgi:hypothetical protein